MQRSLVGSEMCIRDRNAIKQTVNLTDDGLIVIEIESKLVQDQKFKVDVQGISDISVSGGKLSEGEWLVSADGTDTVKNYIFSAKLKGGLIARPVIGKKEDWSPQALQTNTNPLGRQALEVPHGYSTENWEPPKDLYGRNQLFEPTGIAVAKDGTIIVATRSAGIWSCLLYTSPSPRDYAASRMPSSA